MTDEIFRCYDLAIRALTLVGIFVGLCLTGVGLVLTLRQLRTNARQKTAEYITNLQESFYTNKEVLKIYYSIEYGDFKYEEKFHQSANEKALDALLYQLDSIAKIYLLSNFNISDLGIFAYRYLRVYQDEEVQKYMSFLDDWYIRRGFKLKPFDSFRKVAETVEREYYDKASDSTFEVEDM